MGDSQPRLPKRLSFLEKAGYSAGDAAANFVFMPMILFQTTFYTDVFGLTAASAAAILLGGRLWDAIADPLVGMLTDRTETRWGRFRPWVLFTALPWSIIMVLAYTTPVGFSAREMLCYAAVTNVLLMWVYSLNNMPYAALGSVLTADVDERTELNSVRFVFVNIAQFIVGGLTLPLVAKLSAGHDRQHGWETTMGIWALLCLVLFLVTFATTRERIQAPPRPSASCIRDLRDLLSSRPWLIIFLLTIVNYCFLAFRGASLYDYYHHYANETAILSFLNHCGLVSTSPLPYTSWPLQTLDALGYIVRPREAADLSLHVADVFNSSVNVINTIVTILVLLVSPALSRRFGARCVASWGFSLAALFTAGFYILQPGDIMGMILVTIVISACYAPTIPTTWSIFADVADYSEWKMSRRSAGIVFATFCFALKLGLAFGSSGFLWIMSGVFGYDTRFPNTAEAHAGFRICASLLAGLLLAACGMLMGLYQLDRKTTIRMVGELTARRNALRPAAGPG